jgi:hypothetical protein
MRQTLELLDEEIWIHTNLNNTQIDEDIGIYTYLNTTQIEQTYSLREIHFPAHASLTKIISP